MGDIDRLESLARQHDRALMCAKRKDGSWIIYIRPEATDYAGLLMMAAAEIERAALQGEGVERG